MARLPPADVSDSEEGAAYGLSNGNHGGLPHELMNNLNLNIDADVDQNGGSRGGEGSEAEDDYEIDPFQRRVIVRDEDLQPEHTIVHRVLCDHRRVDGEDHEDHPQTADYLDVPRLYKNDTRGSALRGLQPLTNPQEYWDDHPEVCAVVTREYSCGTYHRRQKDQFHLIATGIDKHVFNRLRAWFFRLHGDGPPAVSVGETIMVSQTVTMSLMTLVATNQLGEWNQERNLKAPYDYFYHFRHDLRQLSKIQLQELDRRELDVLLDYIDLTQGKKFDEVDDLFESGKVRREYFGKLFRPNELIVTTQEGHPRAFMADKAYVKDMSDRRIALERQSITLECWTWDFDGSFRKKPSQLQVAWPQTLSPTIPITSLSAWPLRLDQSDMRERLDKRGKYFWKCRYKALVSYKAPTPTIFELQVTNPKYMIDFATYRQMHPKQFPNPVATDAEMEEEGVFMKSTEPPNDPFCILLPGALPGYAFHDKKWRSLSMEHVGSVPWNENAFKRLVLKETKKETIKALVTVHLKTAQNVDVVENKGNGLIILLHGSPGTGKTLTAESVAEIAHKPLYRVTCGDIGTDAESVEKYMESVLLIGTIWECVVLLDEADVFLEERQVTDLARNALVSVFLRVLEYYEGILILTTNRVGTFDEAFKSRIQLAVHYPALDQKGRRAIWMNFIEILKKRQVDLDYEDLVQRTNELAHTPFNGRQIRNNLWTAAQVAKYKNERLEYKHLEEVIEISEEFERYLEETHGHTDEDNARAQRTRA